MTALLLIVIYFVFVSMGLPDSVLGSSFPAIAENLGFNVDIASYISLVLSSGTFFSSLIAPYLIKKLKTRNVVIISVTITALCLLGFSFSTKLYQFFLIAFPLGMGGGCIDCALNDYVSLHYKAIHMNWLHSSWGVGVTISPLIISSFIDPTSHSAGWNKGVLVLSIIQFSIVVLLLLSIPLRKKAIKKDEEEEEEFKEESIKPQFKNIIFYLAIFAFFFYTALEYGVGLWAASFFNIEKALSTDEAALISSYFYGGIMIGRFISGLISLKVKEKYMIRIGEIIILCGVIAWCLPINTIVMKIAVICIGLGCAPIFPAMIRITQDRFSKGLSQKVISFEMALCYVGNMTLPPLLGVIAQNIGKRFYFLPYALLGIAIFLVACNEGIVLKQYLNKKKLSEENN